MISLIHPSRGRPQKSFDNVVRWTDRAANDNLQVIVSCDYSDKDLDDYLLIYKPIDDRFGDLFEVTVNPNDSVVQATNRGCHAAAGEILVYLSDDFDCPENWDQLIESEFTGVRSPMLLKVDDCLQRFDVGVCTIPIMNRALYEKLGYFWHPEYKSMHVDVDLFETCKKIGAIKYAPHLKFPHNHYSNGKAAHDETYKRSEGNWDQGLQVLKRRRAQGFPI